MKRHLSITTAPIEASELASQRASNAAMGAVVCFLGVVRGTEDGRVIDGIEYEAFLEMAQHQFGQIFNEVERRWPVDSIRLIHRIGYVKAGDASLWVELVAPHRGEALAACQFLIDEMKRVVPIWKKPVSPSL
jgi:molybdopterin synthase catalytic subunit